MLTNQKILVTGAGGAAAISIMKALRDEPVDFIAADTDPYAAGLYLVPPRQRVILPPGNSATFVARLLQACKSHAIDVLIPTVDVELLHIADNRDDFEAAGVQVMLAPKAALSLCLDKWSLYRACKASIPVPRTSLFGETFNPDGWSFPLIVKPRQGSGSRGVVLVNSRHELSTLVRSETLIVQEFLPGPEYSVDIMVSRTGEVLAVVPRERLKIDSGVAVAARTVLDPALDSLARRIAIDTGLCYTANIQFRCNAEGKPVLLEINPRFPGTMPLTVASGVNMPRLCLKDLLGLPILTDECRFTETATVRFWEERFVSCEEIETLENTAVDVVNRRSLSHSH